MLHYSYIPVSKSFPRAFAKRVPTLRTERSGNPVDARQEHSGVTIALRFVERQECTYGRDYVESKQQQLAEWKGNE